MSTAPTVQPELCHGTYQAFQFNKCIVISATGVHMTSGYAVFFRKSPADIFPPQFSLIHIFKGGPALDVVSPFCASTSFEAEGQVKNVIVWDADGQHQVPVASFGQQVEAHAKQYFGKDGPFPVR